MGLENVKHDNLGRAVAKSEDELAQFAALALAKLKALPGKIQGFFRDPSLGYISSTAV